MWLVEAILAQYSVHLFSLCLPCMADVLETRRQLVIALRKTANEFHQISEENIYQKLQAGFDIVRDLQAP